MALGVESAAPRVLGLINKGIEIPDIKAAIVNLAEAGVAVEAMCFTDFPTETCREAIATIRFLDDLHDYLSLFICGRFDLVHGSLIAQSHQDFGLREIWQVIGDEFGMGLFYEEKVPSKSRREQEKIETAMAQLSSRRLFHRYPWAGSLSTAHTLLWYDYHGPDIFKRAAHSSWDGKFFRSPVSAGKPRFDLKAMAEQSAENEERIWHELIYKKRAVSRAAYRQMTKALA